MNDAREARHALADAAIALWDSVVKDGDHDFLLRENGWAFAIGGDDDYCGHTVAVAGRHVGDHMYPSMCASVEILPAIRRRVLPSTARLAGFGPSDATWEACQTPEPGFPRAYNLQRGDIATIGDGYGHHIVLVDGAPARDGTFDTIEGNSTGELGDGTHGKGIVRKTRNTADVARTYRLKAGHFRGIR